MNPNCPEDSLALLLEARTGDSEAMANVMARYRDRLLARIRPMLGPQARQEAESMDFLQDVMVKVLRAFEQLEIRDETSCLRWMTAIARNSVRSKAMRSRERAFESLSVATISHRESETPSKLALAGERALLLAEDLERLDEQVRSAIELRKLHDRAVARLGCEVG